MSLFGRKKSSDEAAAKAKAAGRKGPGLDDLQLPGGGQDQIGAGSGRGQKAGERKAGAQDGGERKPPGQVSAPGGAADRMQGEAMARSDNQSSGFRPELPRRPVSEIPGMRPTTQDSGTRGGGSVTDPKTLIVGKEISLNGEISSCDRLIVEGKVEASLAGCQFIEIADGGVFKGAAEIHDAEIRGLFEGKLTVQGRLWICATGRVVGEVRYGQIEIECGGEVSGTIDKAPAGLSPRVEHVTSGPVGSQRAEVAMDPAGPTANVQ